jgi:Holliday junction resolvase
VSTPYRRGSDFERRAKAKLEDQGHTVFRTAGSRSPVDLIAMFRALEGNTVVIFVQCKSGVTKIGRKDRMALVDLAIDCGAIPMVCTRGLKFEILSRVAGTSDLAA